MLERYTAFTCRNHVIRRFEVTHEPWQAVPLDATLVESDLPATAGGWWGNTQLVAGHFSPGVYDVGITPRLEWDVRFRDDPPVNRRLHDAARRQRGNVVAADRDACIGFGQCGLTYVM